MTPWGIIVWWSIFRETCYLPLQHEYSSVQLDAEVTDKRKWEGYRRAANFVANQNNEMQSVGRKQEYVLVLPEYS